MFILVGWPGSGKTYLTRQLSQQLIIHPVSAEQIRATILDRPSLSPTEERLVRRTAFFLIEEFLKAGLAVICDLPAQTSRQRLELLKLAKTYKYPVVTLYQQVDKQVAWLRCQSRRSHRVDDKYALNLDQKTFDIFTSQLEAPEEGEIIVLSGSHAFETQSRIIVRRLLELRLLPEDAFPAQRIVKPGLINLVSPQSRVRPDLSSLAISLNKRPRKTKSRATGK